MSATLVARALRQTVRAGHGYVALPLDFPGQDDITDADIEEAIAGLDRDATCAAYWLDEEYSIEHICLLDRDHDGDHGWPPAGAAAKLRAEALDRWLVSDDDSIEEL